jgi:hypothetical protein
MSDDMKKFTTSEFVPVTEGELRWVFIDAPGKPAMDPTKPNRKQASLYVKTDSDGCKAFIAALKEFWNANKAKGQKLKSLGYKEEVTLKEGGDEDNEDDYVKTGYTSFAFWTGATWPDGNDRVVDIYNAKGNKVSLGGKKIGNGSLGAISGTMAMYHNGTNHGVSLYLNAIQLVKFVEFSQDAGFEAQEEVEGGFEGVDTEFEGTTSEESSGEAQPRL